MRRAIKITVFAVAGLLLSVVGLVIGYQAGIADTAASTVSVQSALTVGALRALRQGKTDEAVHRLETALDGNLITYWAIERDWRLDLFSHHERELIRLASDYRKEFPSQSPSAEVRAWIEEISSENRTK